MSSWLESGRACSSLAKLASNRANVSRSACSRTRRATCAGIRQRVRTPLFSRTPTLMRHTLSAVRVRFGATWRRRAHRSQASRWAGGSTSRGYSARPAVASYRGFVSRLLARDAGNGERQSSMQRDWGPARAAMTAIAVSGCTPGLPRWNVLAGDAAGVHRPRWLVGVAGADSRLGSGVTVTSTRVPSFTSLVFVCPRWLESG